MYDQIFMQIGAFVREKKKKRKKIGLHVPEERILFVHRRLVTRRTALLLVLYS